MADNDIDDDYDRPVGRVVADAEEIEDDNIKRGLVVGEKWSPEFAAVAHHFCDAGLIGMVPVLFVGPEDDDDDESLLVLDNAEEFQKLMGIDRRPTIAEAERFSSACADMVNMILGAEGAASAAFEIEQRKKEIDRLANFREIEAEKVAEVQHVSRMHGDLRTALGIKSARNRTS